MPKQSPRNHGGLDGKGVGASGKACLPPKWRFIHRGLKTRYLDHRAELSALAFRQAKTL
jgi:hypothetical protein